MNNKESLAEDIEFLQLIQGALKITYEKDFSIKQIQEAYLIAELTTAIFRDSLEKIYREKYGSKQK
ncbi:MAG: hypothetical protein A3B23_02145 [Candidatus Colwellbacteria bacterium RIFCSPLOWO2_01_FULL_48_10]|uniref:Uncharacterized protein n=1 Tax=Candidatus Colwellbacteria bacterium RIFCSPLOWO2_01_FULL_48_10 TaxID=1797690 RepID=A0A1G1Z659_9BACT|nr:MAG: hypothetical protein A3B23_02145 [Candidatus Colwellbacteria bacterium RIFCSPLOWO2_01_FULL_48_10]